MFSKNSPAYQFSYKFFVKHHITEMASQFPDLLKWVILISWSFFVFISQVESQTYIIEAVYAFINHKLSKVKDQITTWAKTKTKKFFGHQIKNEREIDR